MCCLATATPLAKSGNAQRDFCAARLIIGPRTAMLPLLLAATFALPAVGVAVVAHLRQWRKTCAPAPDEVEATQPAEAAPTEDQAEPQEAAGQAEATPPNDQAPKDDQAEQRDAGAQPSRHRPASAVGCGLHIPPPQQIWTNHLGQDLPCGARTFQIFVKEGRRTKTLDVTSDFTASDIKAGVSPKAGYSLLDEPTYIKRCGKVMTDAMTLGQLGVGKDDQVHVLTQLPGGMNGEDGSCRRGKAGSMRMPLYDSVNRHSSYLGSRREAE